MWDLIIWYDNTVDFVPSKWANADCTEYKYPEGIPDHKIRKLIYECTNIDNNFTWCRARLKKKSIKDLNKARELCSKAENTSNIESDSDESPQSPNENNMNRKRKKPKRLIEEQNISKQRKRRAIVKNRLKMMNALRINLSSMFLHFRHSR